MGRLAWQAVLKDGTGRKVKALLLENGKVMDTIATDEQGTGVFSLRPKAQTEYGVQLLGRADSAKAQVYPLPPALPSGTVVKIANALATDALTVAISASEASKLSLAISSAYTRETIVTPLFAVEGQGKKMKIPLTEVKKGLNTLTLLDGFGRPGGRAPFLCTFRPGS